MSTIRYAIRNVSICLMACDQEKMCLVTYSHKNMCLIVYVNVPCFSVLHVSTDAIRIMTWHICCLSFDILTCDSITELSWLNLE